MNDAEFKAVVQPHDIVQAELIKGALENAGISTYIDNENFASTRGSVGIGVGKMAVMVPESQAELAIKIIKALALE